MVRRRQQGIDGRGHHVGRHAPQPAAQLTGQLGRRGPVVGHDVGPLQSMGVGHHRLGHPDMAAGPIGLRDGVVRHLPAAGRAEAPPGSLDIEEPGVGQRVEQGPCRVLPQRLTELDQRAVRPGRAENGSVVEHGPLVRRQLVQAGRHQRPQGVRQLPCAAALGHQLGQLLEEQRVATAAVVQLLDERQVGPFAEHRPQQLAGRFLAERLQAQGEGGEPGRPRRRRQVSPRASGGDERKGRRGQASERGLEQLEHAQVGPVEVGHHQGQRPSPGQRGQHGQHRPDQLLVGARRIDAIERRGVPEQVEQAIDQGVAVLLVRRGPDQQRQPVLHA